MNKRNLEGCEECGKFSNAITYVILVAVVVFLVMGYIRENCEGGVAGMCY